MPRLIDLGNVLAVINASMLNLEYTDENRAMQKAISMLPTVDIDAITESHEKIGYDKGYRDGYAQATVDAEPVKQERCEFCKDGKTFLGAVLVLGNDDNWHSIKYCPNCGAKMDEVEDE